MKKFFFHFNTAIPVIFWAVGIIDIWIRQWDKAAMNFALGCLMILMPIWFDLRRKEYDNEF